MQVLFRDDDVNKSNNHIIRNAVLLIFMLYDMSNDSLRMVRMKGIENDIDLAGCEMSDGESSSDRGDTE